MPGLVSYARRKPHLLLLLPALILLVGIFAIPMAAILIISVQHSDPFKNYDAGFTLQGYGRLLTTPFYLGQLARTMRIAALTTLLCAILGTPVAFKLWRAHGRRKTVLLAIVLLPLFTNIIARVYAWLLVFAKNGPINWLLVESGVIDKPVLLNFRFFTVIVGVTYVALPFFILILYSALEGVDWTLVEGARTLGASPARSMIEIVFPLVARGAAGALAIAFTWGAGAFAEPQVLGSPKEWTTGIEVGSQILRVFNWPFGAALAFALVAVTLVVVFLIFTVLVRGERAHQESVHAG
jgi:ABC-type spermidine/putrescine transport system permease subunit I